jgi:outer membrane protein TolC
VLPYPRSRTLAALLLAVGLGAGGCKHFEPAPLSAADSAAALESRSLGDPGLRALFDELRPGTWPPAQWDLTALTLAALYFHPSLDVARAQWRVAQAGVRTAGALPNPTLVVVPQYVANAGGSPAWDVTSALDWPIETAGKRGHRIARAEQLERSARLGLDSAAWQVRAALRASLLEFAAASGRAERLRREEAAQGDVVALLEQRVRAGAASAAEAAPARIAALQSAADVAEAERQEREARVRVAEAIGLVPGALEGVELVFPLDAPAAADAAPEELRRQALQERPEVLAALADYEATQAALQLEIARQYPDLRVGPGYEYDQGLNKWSTIGISVELPVMNRNQGPIAEAEARRSEAAARFLALQSAVIGELERALANRASAREALARSEATLAAERDRERQARRSLAAGASDRVAWDVAQVELARAERIQLDAEVRLQQSIGDIEAAVQQPLELGGTIERERSAPSGAGAP